MNVREGCGFHLALFVEFMECTTGENHIQMCVRLVDEVLEQKETIEEQRVIEKLLQFCESAFSSYNQLMPESCYEGLKDCILHFIKAVQFGDKFAAAFELWDCVLALI